VTARFVLSIYRVARSRLCSIGTRGAIATIMLSLSERIAQLDPNLQRRAGNELVINHSGSITIKNNVSQVTLRLARPL
jgi:hypothetical protein